MATKLTNTQTDRPALSAEGRVFEISKAITFEAAHRLPGRGKDETYGRVHGHSFRLEATVSGTVKPGQLWVEDIAVLTSVLGDVAEILDHQMLNDVPGLEVPTLENIALWVAAHLQDKLAGLSMVTIERPSLNERCSLRF